MPKEISYREAMKQETLGLTQLPGGGSAGADHGLLSGLGDDDHLQYVHKSIARTITAQHTINLSGAPFILGAGAQGQVVTGFKADQLNKQVTAGAGLGGGGYLTADRDLYVNLGTGLGFSGDDIVLAWSGTPVTIVPDATGGGGSSAYAARIDHVHGIACAAPATNLSVSSTNQEGTGNDFARALHMHGIDSSANPGAATSILKSDVSGYLQLVRLGIATAPGVPLHVAGAAEQARLEYNATNYASFTVGASGGLTISTVSGGAGGNMTLLPAGDIITDPTGNEIRPQLGYEVNIGTPFKKYLSIYAAELHIETLVAEDVQATIGGHILVAPTTVLTRDCQVADTTIYVKHNEMASGDRVRLEADGFVEFMAITSAPTPGTELLSNPGFETAGGGGADVFANWEENAGDGSIVDETTIVNSGAHACKLTAGVHVDTYVKQAAAVTAGKKYFVEFYVRGSATSTAPARFQVYDASNGADIIALAPCGAFATYTKRIYWFMAPEGCSSVEVYLYCPATSTAIAYFDDASIREAEYSYTVTRDLDGSGANFWPAGSAIVNTGTTGDGFINIYSVHGIREPNETGPTIVGNIRNSATFNDWSEHWALGNLNGLYDYGSTAYGVALGNYANSHAWIGIDSTWGLRIMHRTGGADVQMAQWDISGNILVGQEAVSKSNIYITAGEIRLRVNATNYATLSTAGVLTLGQATIEHLVADSTSIKLYGSDGSTVRAELDGSTLTLGATGSGEYIQVDPTNGIRIYNNAVLSGQWKADGSLVIGPATTRHIEIDTTNGLRVFSTSTAVRFQVTTGGVVYVGDQSNAYAYISGNIFTMYSPSAVFSINNDVISMGAPAQVKVDSTGLYTGSAGKKIWAYSTGGLHGVEFYGATGAASGNSLGYVVAPARTGASADDYNKVHVGAYGVSAGLAAYWEFYSNYDGTEYIRGVIGSNSILTVYDGYCQVSGYMLLDQATGDDNIIEMRSTGDVAHGMTSYVDTACFGVLEKRDDATGGTMMRGFSEDVTGLYFQGLATNDNTTKTTSALGYIMLAASKKSGTSASNVGTDANLVVIRDHNISQFIFDKEGSAHANVEWTTFDEYDDVALMTALEKFAGGDPISDEFGEFLEYNKDDLERLGLAHFDEIPGHAMVNFTRLAMLHTGGMRQHARRLVRLERQLHAYEQALLDAGIAPPQLEN